MMIYFYNEDFDKVTFIANQRHILPVDLDKINLDNDNKVDEYDPCTIIHVRLLAGCSRFKKHKTLKKICEELMPVAWHPKRWWDFCMSKDEKEEIVPIFTE